MTLKRLLLLLSFVTCLTLSSTVAETFSPADSAFYSDKIQPLLEQRCYECHSHGAKKLKAGLFLDSRSGVLQGGDSGPALVPGKPDESRLIKAVRYDDVDSQMPPKTKLPDAEVALLDEWVRRGAPWSANETVAKSASGAAKEFNLADRRKNHWAWQPVRAAEPPKVADVRWPAQPLDNFILAKLEAAKLTPAPEADHRTLIRRLSFTLTGLPPTPDEVEAFANDRSRTAYGQLVQRLLNSRRFGERWARHWLDVVRYSETLGHEFDYSLPNAWRYRDYLIRTLNADLPFDQFIREHIAGDLMKEPRREPATGLNESATATAFFWFGQQVHSPVDIKANQLDVIDNQIDTLTRGFQALTVSCARCHDHKFDAISAKDFYALYGVLKSSRYAQSDVGDEAVTERQIDLLSKLREEFTSQIDGSDRSKEAETSSTSSKLPSPIFDGWLREGAVLRDGLVAKGELLYLGPTNPVVRAALPLVSSRKLSRHLQGSIRSPNFSITNRYLHVRVAGHGSRVKLILENFQMIQDPIYGGLKKGINSDELQWLNFDLAMWSGRRAYLEVLDLSAPDLAGSGGSGVSPDGWFDLAGVVASDDAKPPQQPDGYEAVGVPSEARDTFERLAKLQAEGAQPAITPAMADSEGLDENVFIRGGPSKPGELVPRRYLEALGGLEHPITQGSGREVIADLIAAPDNPLTARVWVNRVWHHLFGRGLVATVDDFGVLGERPSHPELLDWLANWFVTEGRWSTKKLIQLLVTSSTWKQSALAADDRGTEPPLGANVSSNYDQLDPDNVLLHKWTARRLEGEAIRDSVLAISGRLNLEPPPTPVPTHLTSFMTGRGRPGQSGPLDGDGKRSIYLEVRRNFMSPMMLAFDTPQAAQTFGRRARSNVPAQALILLNDPFVQQQARIWAERMIKECGKDTDGRINWLYAQGFQRRATGEELGAAHEFLAAQNADEAGARLSDSQAGAGKSVPPGDAAGQSTSPASDERQSKRGIDSRTVPSELDTRASGVAAWADLCHVLFNTKEFVFMN